MSAPLRNQIADRVRETTAELMVSSVKLLAGGLFSGTLVVLQQLLSRAARSGGGLSYLGALPFHVYIDVFAVGYVALVAVVAMALAFADDVREAIQLLLLPIVAAVPLTMLLQLLGGLKTPFDGYVAMIVVAGGAVVFWVQLYRLALPPENDRELLRAAARQLHVLPPSPREFAALFWRYWTRRRIAVQGWFASHTPQAPWIPLKTTTFLARSPLPQGISPGLQTRLHAAALRIVVLRLLITLQVVLIIGYVASSRDYRRVFDFDPRPLPRADSARYQFAASVPGPAMVAHWDRLAQDVRIDSVMRDTLLRSAHLYALKQCGHTKEVGLRRYLDVITVDAAACAPISSIASSRCDCLPRRLAVGGHAKSETTTAPKNAVDSALRPGPTRSAALARNATDSALRLSSTQIVATDSARRRYVEQVSAAYRRLLEDEILRAWAHAIDGRHRWLGAMLACLGLSLVLCLGYGPHGVDHYWQFRRLSAYGGGSGGGATRANAASFLGLSREQRTLAAVAVVVVAMLPMLRTIDPEALSVERPRSVFDGGSWSAVPLEPLETPTDEERQKMSVSAFEELLRKLTESNEILRRELRAGNDRILQKQAGYGSLLESMKDVVDQLPGGTQ